jgi:hypothetical protein
VGACSPTDFIKELAQLFMGVTCDHSLGGSQVFTMFYKCLLKKRGAPGGPGCSKSAQNGHNFLLSVRKPAQNNKQTKTKDAQKHFGSVFGY